MITNYTVNARFLTIVHGDNPDNWRWVILQKDKEVVEVAELVTVFWLEVKGKIKMNVLRPNVKYEAFFQIMMKKDSFIESEVTFTLQPPYAMKQERKVSLDELMPEKWTLVKIGEFRNPQEPNVEIAFSLTNCDALPKSGLVIKSVIFMPCF